MKKKEDIKNKSMPEINKLIADLRVRTEKIGLELRLRKIKDSNAVKKLKIELARLLTARREKEL